MNNFFIKVKCKFCNNFIEMPYEEVYFQRLDEDSEYERKSKQLPKKS